MRPIPTLRLPWATGLVVAALTLAGCGGSGSSPSSATGPSSGTSSASAGASAASRLCPTKGHGAVTVGAFNFAESELLATVYADALRHCGYTTTVRQLGSREVVYPALKAGQIDVVPEYAATLTDFINNQVNGPAAPSKASGALATTMAALRAELPKNLVALQPSAATDKDAFAITKAFASAAHLSDLSQLAAYSHGHPVTLGGPPECPTRPYCEKGLQSVYGMAIARFVALDSGGPLTIAAIKSGKVTVGEVFTSDPTVGAQGLVILADNKHLQASDNIVPIVNTAVNGTALDSALNAVGAALTQSALVQMNAAVQVSHASPGVVAQQFLQQAGLT